jgi:2-iminoacetate synthase
MTTTLCETREKPATFIDEAEIEEILEESRNYRSRRVRDALAKARELKGLDAREIAALMEVDDPVLLEEIFAIARWVKEEIYGNRLVLFAPLYISNLCKNECLYCAFRSKNTELKRKVMTQEEIANEVKILIQQGHKRLLLVAGESYPMEGFNYS